MNLETAANVLKKSLAGKQDPDSVEFHKQWDEFGALKGWHVDCVWEGTHESLEVWFDMTPYYNRIIGDFDKIPEFIPGTHQRVDL